MAQFTIPSFEDLAGDLHQRTSHYFENYAAVLREDQPRLLHWIGSVSYSGDVREHSLRYLIKHYQPGDENRILLRLSDWVPQVYQLAERWTLQQFPALTLGQIGAQHRVILFLTRKEHLADSEPLRVINEMLVAQAVAAASEDFYQLPSILREHVYRLAGDTTPALRQFMLADPAPKYRQWLLDLVGYPSLTDEERTCLREDASLTVRRALVRAQIAHQVTPTRDELLDFALARNGSMRHFGRYYLEKFYGTDGYTLYRKQTDERFYYIRDFARPEDVPDFLAGMTHPSRQVQYLCLGAICTIDPSLLRQLPIPQLLTHNTRTRRLLARHISTVFTLDEIMAFKPMLWTLGFQGSEYFLNLLFRTSFWHFVDEALALILDVPIEPWVSFVHKRVRGKVHYGEPVPEDVSDSIAWQLKALQKHTSARARELSGMLTFAFENA